MPCESTKKLKYKPKSPHKHIQSLSYGMMQSNPEMYPRVSNSGLKPPAILPISQVSTKDTVKCHCLSSFGTNIVFFTRQSFSNMVKAEVSISPHTTKITHRDIYTHILRLFSLACVQHYTPLLLILNTFLHWQYLDWFPSYQESH